jgi:NADPH-dependent 2,4-dienoyl-CoA reductase/sulfur reductase-like enzyme
MKTGPGFGPGAWLRCFGPLSTTTSPTPGGGWMAVRQNWPAVTRAGPCGKGENVTLRAVVVGGGLGGMAAAVALSRAGIDVQAHEQAQQLTEVGAGVSLAPNGLRMLARLGVGEGIGRVGCDGGCTTACRCRGGAAGGSR